MKKLARCYHMRFVAILLTVIILFSSCLPGVSASAAQENSGSSSAVQNVDVTITRGMVVSLLYQMEGQPDVIELENPFSDVAAEMYYTNAVKWAAANCLVFGYPGGKYCPEKPITREQLAVILDRYYAWNNNCVSVDGKTTLLSPYSYASDLVVDCIYENIRSNTRTLPRILIKELSVPIYNQYVKPDHIEGNTTVSGYNQGSSLCWATSAAMWISYLLGDNLNRTVEIAKATKKSEDPRIWNTGGRLYDALNTMLPNLDLTEIQNQIVRYYNTISYEKVTELIDKGSPIGIGYGYYTYDSRNSRTTWNGHYVLIVGYMDIGDEQYIISVDPAGGLKSVSTFTGFHAYNRNRNYKWDHTEY